MPMFEKDVFNSPNGSRKTRFPKFVDIKMSPSQNSMRRVLTWKPSDEHPQGTKAKVLIDVSASKFYRVESGKSDAVEAGKDAHASVDSIQPCRVGIR